MGTALSLDELTDKLAAGVSLSSLRVEGNRVYQRGLWERFFNACTLLSEAETQMFLYRDAIERITALHAGTDQAQVTRVLRFARALTRYDAYAQGVDEVAARVDRLAVRAQGSLLHAPISSVEYFRPENSKGLQKWVHRAFPAEIYRDYPDFALCSAAHTWIRSFKS